MQMVYWCIIVISNPILGIILERKRSFEATDERNIENYRSPSSVNSLHSPRSW